MIVVYINVYSISNCFHLLKSKSDSEPCWFNIIRGLHIKRIEAFVKHRSLRLIWRCFGDDARQ